MTSPTSGFAPDAGRGALPTISTAYSTAGGSDAVSPPPAATRDNVLHAHRQSHNSSKLPTFRFADLKRDPIVLPSLIPLPDSPSPCPPGENQDNASATPLQAQGQTRHIPGLLSRENLHQISNAHNLSSDKSVAFETQLPNAQNSTSTPQQPQHQPALTKTRSLKFQFVPSTATATPSTIAPATAPTPTAPAIATDPSTAGTKRPASFSDAPRVVGGLYANKASQLAYVATPVTKRRLTASAAVQETPSSVPRPSPSFTRLRTIDSGDSKQTVVPESTTKDWAQGQRDLLLPKEDDDAEEPERKKPRPPSSYRPATSHTGSTTGGRAAIPPIRGFRSSIARKSVVIDMRDRRVADNIYGGQESSNSNQHDKTLHALEGRTDDFTSQETADMTTTTDNDNTADLFLRIASETSTRRVPEFKGKVEDPSAASRITRISHRRPLSTAVATFQANSPPQLARRLSDQRETTRSRQRPESNTAQQMTRELAYRTSARDKLNPIMTSSTTTITTTEEPSPRTVSIRTPLKPSAIATPRSIQFQDTLSDSASAYQRRRQSLTTNNENHPSSARAPQYRSSNLAQSRIYHSSPLVPKPMIPSKDDPIPSTETHQGAEGNESSSSTAAPSTVWDELDDLKSRINRLELTGKMPSSSGAAMSMSRTSDDRPPTATTNATTMSASPKRGSGASASQPNVNSSFTSNTSSHRGETQPLLISALNKTKGLVGSEAFSAMESAANDVLALTTMLGTSGQPGPISSGASAIGYGSNNGSVTDRQLRRRADGICRSLTELYIALADELAQKQGSGSSNKRGREEDGLASPTSARRPVVLNTAAASASRRQSAVADTITPLPPKSPRAPTSLEVKRQSILAAAFAPTAPSAASGRYAAVPGTPVDSVGAGRKSSLLLARARRAGTEDPEELSGRRSSLLLRTRRATTEEPEDQPQQPQQSTPALRNEAGRKTSLLLRTRKTMNDVDDLDNESRYRTPSRAVTEVNSSFRSGVTASAPRESARSPPDLDLPTGSSSALPRRRLVPSSLNARLVIPAVSGNGPTTPIPRRYLERATPMRESMMTNGDAADKIIIEEGQRGNQRQFLQLSSSSGLGRSNSLNGRRRGEGGGGSGIPTARESRVELLQGMQGREREYR
ncbi:hypothetical protein QBC40DRAFT_257964 [Triangularia verruculosa]|uniref:Uncharacterized protein n=1 Tax=Triangularia verruculosa TaxID=2587418 RepID=A0AAN6X9R1_9PEZI|nr:hypothetical protein QBC40DRAFT_257964 [Triangularia verruculosa]